MDIDFLALSVLELESWVYREKVVRKGIVMFIGQSALRGQEKGSGVGLKLRICDFDHSCPCHGESQKWSHCFPTPAETWLGLPSQPLLDALWTLGIIWTGKSHNHIFELWGYQKPFFSNQDVLFTSIRIIIAFIFQLLCTSHKGGLYTSCLFPAAVSHLLPHKQLCVLFWHDL